MLSTSAILTLIFLAAAIILLVFTRLRPDLIALMVLLALGLSGIVSDKQVFSGFSSSAVMTILGISMISVALQQTGATNAISKLIYHLGKTNEILLILLVTLSSAVLSLFMNNIAAVGVLLPAVMSLTRHSHISPSRLMMPLAFGTILGGMATLLTTSNIIVSSALKDAGQASFGLLDFFPVGAPVVLVGIIYMITLGRKLLPKGNNDSLKPQTQGLGMKLKDLYALDEKLCQVKVLPDSILAGQTIKSGGWSKHGLNVLTIQRRKNLLSALAPGLKILAGDILLCTGTLTYEQFQQLGLVQDATAILDLAFSDDCILFTELVVTPHSTMIGKTLQQVDFREKYDLNVISLWREGKAIRDDFNTLSLRFGDALLAQGSAEKIRQMHRQNDLIVLEEDPDAVLRPQKTWLAASITLLTLGFAATDILPVAEVVLLGAVLLLLTRCLTMNDAFQSIEWKAIFLIAGMWPLSIAIQHTGLASALVDTLIKSASAIPPLAVAALFLTLAMVFTQLMSGQISAIVLIPLALTAATTLSISPQALAIAVALGCSLAFPTPLGHPVNIMVMNAGGYTFRDFLKVGLPLTILAFVTILFGIHFVYGL